MSEESEIYKDIENALNSGAKAVGINTAVVNNTKFLKKAVKNFGISNIVVSIEAKKVDEEKLGKFILIMEEREQI